MEGPLSGGAAALGAAAPDMRATSEFSQRSLASLQAPRGPRVSRSLQALPQQRSTHSGGCRQPALRPPPGWPGAPAPPPPRPAPTARAAPPPPHPTPAPRRAAARRQTGQGRGHRSSSRRSTATSRAGEGASQMRDIRVVDEAGRDRTPKPLTTLRAAVRRRCPPPPIPSLPLLNLLATGHCPAPARAFTATAWGGCSGSGGPAAQPAARAWGLALQPSRRRWAGPTLAGWGLSGRGRGQGGGGRRPLPSRPDVDGGCCCRRRRAATARAATRRGTATRC
jgi:hypothetical protein